jgi:hypothetical protein
MLKRALKRMVRSAGRDLFNVYCDPVNALRLEALDDTVQYIKQNARQALALRDRDKLLDIALSRIPREGVVAEFGVHKGKSIAHIARRVRPRPVFGFDSFRGNPEDWSGWNAPRGVFDMRGALPKVPDNVELVIGYFDDTLPRWAGDHDQPIAFAHIDCDLYSSTRSVFEHLYERFVSGTVIVFDEYFNYANWREHEHKAFMEFVERSGKAYHYLAYSTQQIAVIME